MINLSINLVIITIILFILFFKNSSKSSIGVTKPKRTPPPDRTFKLPTRDEEEF